MLESDTIHREPHRAESDECAGVSRSSGATLVSLIFSFFSSSVWQRRSQERQLHGESLFLRE